VPQKLDIGDINEHVVIYFRSREERDRTKLTVSVDGKRLFSKVYAQLRPPEMERLKIDFKAWDIKQGNEIVFELGGDEGCSK
jgi:hypothetical protein